MKRCSKCKVEKPRSEFGKDKRRPDGLYPQCRECKSTAHKESYHKVAAKRLEQKYGITSEQRAEMFEAKKGCCKICGKHESEQRRALAVDHCHTTGAVRGLLCDNCNRGIGYFRDNPELLKAAIKYLGG